MRFRVFWAVLLLGTAGLVVSACDGSTAATATPSPRTLHIAAILPGSITDRGWSQDAYKGLTLCKNQLGAEIAYTENLPGRDTDAVKKALNDYADSKKYDLIIAHGDEYQQTIIDVANNDKYKDQHFGIISGYAGNNKNLAGITYTSGTATYLMGALAGLKTQTGKISYIRAQGKPDSNEAAQIALGIKEANPNARYMGMQILGDWDDPKGAAKLAEQAIAAGVDVIIVNTDQGDQAVADVGKAKGVSVVAWTRSVANDQNTSVISAVDSHADILYLEAARRVMQGLWKPQALRFGLGEHAIDMSPIRAGALSLDAIRRFEAIKGSLISGKTVTNAAPPDFKLNTPVFTPLPQSAVLAAP